MNANQLINESTRSMASLSDPKLDICVGRSNYSAVGSFYNNVDPSVAVRPPMDRQHYEYFRPNEEIPIVRTQEDIRRVILLCTSVYDRVGVVRSVVDLMSEFAAQGIEIVHEDAIPNEFWKAWSKRVRLPDRVERALNWLYKGGNFVVRRHMGTIDNYDVRKLKRTNKSGDGISPGRIPLRYEFYHPASMELIGGYLGALSQNKLYGVKIPFKILDGLKSAQTDLEKAVYNSLPPEIKSALSSDGKRTQTSGGLVVPIPNELLFVGHYKKDDSDIWAKPIIYSILGDIFYNDKLKLAKTSALDGWYNVTRLWKLGDHKVGIFASNDLFNKLMSILEHNVGGGANDILWRSDIDVQELYPPVDKLVNFEENIDAILLGLGVPQSIVGGDSKDSAGPNPIVGLRNLIMRIEAGRRVIIEWLEEEITIITNNMGFRKKPFIRFTNANLHDEQTYFNLLVQLVDRNILSDQTILEKIREVPELERSRVIKENQDKDGEEYPEKASPYHKPELKDQRSHELKMLRMKESYTNKDNSRNITQRNNDPTTKNGRPPGSRDKVTRRRRPNKSKNFAELLIYANKLHDCLDSWIKDSVLSHFGVADLRSCTNEHLAKIETYKFLLLANFDPDTEIAEQNINELCQSGLESYDDFKNIFESLLKDVGADKLTNEQKRLLLVQSYAMYWSTNGV